MLRRDMSAKAKSKKEKAKLAKKEKGQPRTGAKANKEALTEIKKRLDECLTKEEYEKSSSDVQRAIASVTVFKTQMKVFEKKFLSDTQYQQRVQQTDELLQKATLAFETRRSS